jgi:threonine dehydrogenase-like Zn-dependent dehydrogenase
MDDQNGVFAEYFHVNDADMNLALLPKGMPLEQAVMLSDMATTGIQGAEMAKIKTGSTVAVIGIGPVGLMAVAGASILGAGRLIAVGSRKASVDLALEYGASEIIDYRKGGLVKQILEKTNGKGVDSVIIAGGNENTISDAVKIVKPGGTVSNVNYYGTGNIISIPRIEWGVGMSQKDIRGGLTNGGRLRMERMADLCTHGRIKPEKMATHIFEGFDKMEEALMLMKEKPGDLIKPVVLLDE